MSAAARKGGFIRLARTLRERGLMAPAPAAYGLSVAVHVVLHAGSTLAIMFAPSWWPVAAFGGALALGQLGMVMHDAGHRQLARSRTTNLAVGLVLANLLIGASFEWWVGKHGEHHRFPNDLERDPDLRIFLHAYTPEAAERTTGFRRMAVRYQATLLPLLALFEGVCIRFYSLRYLYAAWRGQRRSAAWRLEASLLAVHYVTCAVLIVVAAKPVGVVSFLLMREALVGLYLVGLFTPNHVGRPVVRPDEKLDFVARQVLTARNLRPSRLVRYFYGPLTFQIEHHLFPTIPLAKLPRARELVRSYCADAGLPYCETTVTEAYREVFSGLRMTAATLEAGGSRRY